MNADIGERLQPCGGAHAIKSVSFVIELDGSLTKDAFREISSLHPKLQDLLPRKTENNAIVFALDPSKGLQTRGSTPELSGVVFDRLMPDGRAEWSLNVSPAHVVVTCENYSRWDKVWPRARSLFEVILPAVLRFRTVTAIGLQYIDEFNWLGNKSEFQAHFLFREDTKYLPPNVFELTESWHNHHGFFQHCTSPCSHKELTNINIGIADRDDSRVISIAAIHRALLSESIVSFDALMGGDESPRHLDEFLETMHQRNKEVLDGLLTASVQEKIGLHT
jgi:uncharacterized protein (TIGR04255 family)